MADLNVAVKVSAETVAEGPLRQVAASLDAIDAASVKAGGSIGGFTVQVLRAAESSSTASKAVSEASFSLEELGKGFAGVVENAASFGLGMAGIQAVSEVFDALKNAIVDIPEQIDAARISFETFTGSLTTANALVSQMQALGTTDPFHTQALLDLSVRLVALGTPAANVASRVQDIATAVAAVGGTDADLQRIGQSLARLQETGTLTSRTMLQLVNEEIPAWQILEVGLGETQAQLTEMLKTGQITADVFDQAFHSWATSGDVAQVLGERADTTSGSLTLLGNAAQEALVVGVAPLTKGTDSLAASIRTLVQDGTVASWGQTLNVAVDGTLNGFRFLAKAASDFNAIMSTPMVFFSAQDQTDYLLRLDQGMQQSYAEAHDLNDAMAEVHGTLGELPPAADASTASMDALSISFSTFPDVASFATDIKTLTVNLKDDETAALAAAKANDALAASNAAARAEVAAQAEALADSNPWPKWIDDTTKAADSAQKAAAAIGSVGQNALTAVQGLSAMDMQIAQDQSSLAKLQLEIEGKVLARMEARPQGSIYQQEALAAEQLKYDQLQKAAGFDVPTEANRIANAQRRAARTAARSPAHFQDGGSFDVPGSGGPDSQYVSFMASPGESVSISPAGAMGGSAGAASGGVTIGSIFGQVNVQTGADADAVGKQVALYLRSLIGGASGTVGRARTQLAGVR